MPAIDMPPPQPGDTVLFWWPNDPRQSRVREPSMVTVLYADDRHVVGRDLSDVPFVIPRSEWDARSGDIGPRPPTTGWCDVGEFTGAAGEALWEILDMKLGEPPPPIDDESRRYMWFRCRMELHDITRMAPHDEDHP